MTKPKERSSPLASEVEASRREPSEVCGIYVSDSRGRPMTRLEFAPLEVGLGIPGDRYATGKGHWSDPKWPDQELTLVEAEVAQSLGIEPSALRRNVVVRGVRLDELIGRSFRMGTALLTGIRPCDPCAYLDSLTRPGVCAALVGRGGVRARVERSGEIRLGDRVELLDVVERKVESEGTEPDEGSSG